MSYFAGHRLRVSEGVLVAQAISSPTVLLKVGVSNGAIPLQYIHSRADLSVLITFSEERLFRFRMGATPCPCYFTTCRIEGRSRAWSKIIKSNGTIQPISWLY